MKGVKGNTGIGILLLLIACILITTLFIVLYIYNANQLQSEGLMAADQTKRAITNKLELSDLMSVYTADHKIQDIEGILMLLNDAPGVNLDDVIISIRSPYSTSRLQFKGLGAETTAGANGYFTFGSATYEIGDTPTPMREDLNADNATDTLSRDGSDVILSVSGEGDIVLGGCSGPETFEQSSGNTDYIRTVSGECEGSEVTSVTLRFIDEGKGYFTAEYIKESASHQRGMVYRGDVLKVFFELAEPLGTDEIVTLSIIHPNGIESIVMFVTPQTPRVGRVSLSHY